MLCINFAAHGSCSTKKIYAATTKGLSVSSNCGKIWVSYAKKQGLISDDVKSVYAEEEK